jgi:hypothetical protein
MYLPAPTESNFSPCPEGSHMGVCYRVIDLGTQKTTYQGEAKIAHKVMLSWELPDERMEDGHPFTISQQYTWSMHEKSNLRKHLETWRGVAFKETDFGPNGFDIRNVIGKSCILGVVHQLKDGKTYANIASVGKAMKGMAIPETTESKQVYVWLHPDRWDPAAFNELSSNLQEKIRLSPEYSEMNRNRHEEYSGAHGLPEQTGGFPDDDIPF